MRMIKSHIKKDDKVKVIAGKDKNKIGKVIKVTSKANKAIVENINIIKRHTKPNMKNRQGGIVSKEAAIHLSNVMVLCNKCMSASKIKITVLEDGQKIRICKKCNEQIDA